MCSLVDAYLENAIEPLASATEPPPWHIGIREVVDWATSAMTPIACVGEVVGAREDIFGRVTAGSMLPTGTMDELSLGVPLLTDV